MFAAWTYILITMFNIFKAIKNRRAEYKKQRIIAYYQRALREVEFQRRFSDASQFQSIFETMTRWLKKSPQYKRNWGKNGF